MMHMTFYWGKTVTILFDSWKTDSWLSYSLSLFACFLFSLLYQYLEELRIRIKIINKPRGGGGAAAAAASIDSPLLVSKQAGRRFPIWRLVSAIFFGINSAIGYLLMLAIMSFNSGVFLAVVVGLSVGYLIFRVGDVDLVGVENPCACA